MPLALLSVLAEPTLLPFAVYTTDATGCITSYNEAVACLWGRQPVLGRDCWSGACTYTLSMVRSCRMSVAR
jgi:hypothetical protein